MKKTTATTARRDNTKLLVKRLDKFVNTLYGCNMNENWKDVEEYINNWVQLLKKKDTKYDLWVYLKYRREQSAKGKMYAIKPMKLTDCLKNGIQLPEDVSFVDIEVRLIVEYETKYNYDVLYSTQFGIGDCSALTERKIKLRYGLGPDGCVFDPSEINEWGGILKVDTGLTV